MKTTILICKGILYYITVTLVMVSIYSIDSLIEDNKVYTTIAVIAILIYTCYKFISYKDLEIITGYRLIKDENDEW